jgi:hypothetical protein
MTSLYRQWTYGTLAVLGLILPWYFNLQFMAANEVGDLRAFVAACFANPAAGSLTMDATVASVAFVAWLLVEAKRLSMRRAWAYIVLIPTVAFAFAFPLFLLMRERRLQVLSMADPVAS